MFSWTAEKVTATDEVGEKELFWGMPVWSVYLVDLSGDGLPEFCATISFGSGIVDTRVVVFDYAADKQYVLSDRAHYDYFLSIEDERLVVTQTKYLSSEPRAKGSLTIINDELIVNGMVN